MGYGTNLYVVDLRRLTDAFGSGDRELLAEVRAQRTNRMVLKRRSRSGTAPWEIPLGQALQELVDGKVTKPAVAHQYGYALELLCRFFAIHSSSDVGDVRDLGLAAALTKPRPPIPIPRHDDHPACSHITWGRSCASSRPCGAASSRRRRRSPRPRARRAGWASPSARGARPSSPVWRKRLGTASGK